MFHSAQGHIHSASPDGHVLQHPKHNFLQGGALSLLQLRADTPLAGVACLSGWLPLAHKPGVVSGVNKGTRVHLWHGTADRLVGQT